MACVKVEKGREARASAGSQPGVQHPATLERPLPGGRPRGHCSVPVPISSAHGHGLFTPSANIFWTLPMTQTLSIPRRDIGDPTLPKPALPGTRITLCPMGGTTQQWASGSASATVDLVGEGLGPGMQGDAGRCGKMETLRDFEEQPQSPGPNPTVFQGQKGVFQVTSLKASTFNQRRLWLGAHLTCTLHPQPQTNGAHLMEPLLHLSPRSPSVYKNIIWWHPFQILAPQFLKKPESPREASRRPRETWLWDALSRHLCFSASRLTPGLGMA